MSGHAEPAETLQWIKDWRDDMFSSTSRDVHGWPIEMHGLAASYEELATENQRLRDALDRITRESGNAGFVSSRIAREALAGEDG